MQVYSIPTTQSEIHYHVQEQSALKHQLSPTTEKIMQLNPSLLLGESNLLKYDPVNHHIELTLPFQNLLSLLVQLAELDSNALKATSLYELNSILQKAQAPRGGLMRENGIERWQLKDNPIMQQYRQTLEELFQELGFVDPKLIRSEMIVDHCVIFGGHTERMEKRILETVGYLTNKLKVTGSIFLLGSNRKLILAEIEHLKSKLEKVGESERIYWNDVFNKAEQSNEANAFEFLWKCIAPQEMQTLFENRIKGIKSTRIGNSYHINDGHRATTEVTVEDWITCYKIEEPQTIFALAEQPYFRLTDQLKWTVLSKGKTADKDEIIERMKNKTFYFASPNSGSSPKVSVVLDEIGRNVYRTVDALKYLESIK